MPTASVAQGTISPKYISPAIKETLRSEANKWLEDRQLSAAESASITRSLNSFLAANNMEGVRFLGLKPRVTANEDLPDEAYSFEVVNTTANWEGTIGEVDLTNVLGMTAPVNARRELADMLPEWATVDRRGAITIKPTKSAGRFTDARKRLALSWGQIAPGMTLGDVQRLEFEIKNFASDKMNRYRSLLADMNAVDTSGPKQKLSAEQRADRYAAFLKNRKLTKAVNDDILTLPIAPQGRNVEASRTWGIEIEHVDCAGIPTPNKWDSRYDGSLNAIYRDDYDDEDDDGREGQAREFVSPVLNKVHSSKMKTLLDALETRRTNSTPGIHVHVGAGDLTLQEQAKLVRNYAIIEPLISGMYARETREYCAEFRPGDIMEAVLSTGRNGTRYFEEKVRVKGKHERYARYLNSNRYVSLNLHAMERHGTVEFRAMGPVYNYEKLIRWARFCREFVNLATKDIPQKTWESLRSWDDLVKLIQNYGSEAAVSTS